MKYRKHIRLKNYDYSTNGYYFVTIVTKNRLPLLCSSKSAIEECIKKLPKFINGLSIDWFKVMNNHIHIIFALNDCSRPLGRIVSAMKSAITKIVTEKANLHSPQQNVCCSGGHSGGRSGGRKSTTIWQWNYYEHIIRSEKALDKIRRYIENNPDIEKPNWNELDKL